MVQLEGNLIHARGYISRIARVAMQAPAISYVRTCIYCEANNYVILHNILFPNMEHSSHKSHVADVTTTGVDAIQHKERLLGQR